MSLLGFKTPLLHVPVSLLISLLKLHMQSALAMQGSLEFFEDAKPSFISNSLHFPSSPFRLPPTHL